MHRSELPTVKQKYPDGSKIDIKVLFNKFIAIAIAIS